MRQESGDGYCGFHFSAVFSRWTNRTRNPNYFKNTMLVFLGLLVTASLPAFGVEHPGIVPKEANCSSCHAAKINGKSVHSAMLTSCTVCHLVATQGDMTMVSLAMHKNQICFACHEKTVELRLHKAAAKGLCVDCHDAHSSDRRMLLRIAADAQPCGESVKRSESGCPEDK
jgi:predicted CXXCH cytochrome family protein